MCSLLLISGQHMTLSMASEQRTADAADDFANAAVGSAEAAADFVVALCVLASHVTSPSSSRTCTRFSARWPVDKAQHRSQRVQWYHLEHGWKEFVGDSRTSEHRHAGQSQGVPSVFIGDRRHRVVVQIVVWRVHGDATIQVSPCCHTNGCSKSSRSAAKGGSDTEPGCCISSATRTGSTRGRSFEQITPTSSGD